MPARLSYGSTAVAVKVTGAGVAAKGHPRDASRQEATRSRKQH